MVKQALGQSLFAVMLALAVAAPAVAQLTEPAAASPETPMVTEAPKPDPDADPFGTGPWHANEDRTLWMRNASFREWRQGLNHKVMWIRPRGTNLIVTGERIDAPSAPLAAKTPCCYTSGFQVGQVTFPAAGCWKVSVTSGEHHLDFVTRVHER